MSYNIFNRFQCVGQILKLSKGKRESRLKQVCQKIENRCSPNDHYKNIVCNTERGSFISILRKHAANKYVHPGLFEKKLPCTVSLTLFSSVLKVQLAWQNARAYKLWWRNQPVTTICRIIQFVQNSCLDQASHRLIMFVEGINSTHLVCVLVIQIVSVVGDVCWKQLLNYWCAVFLCDILKRFDFRCNKPGHFLTSCPVANVTLPANVRPFRPSGPVIRGHGIPVDFLEYAAPDAPGAFLSKYGYVVNKKDA